MTTPYYQDEYVTLYHGDCLERTEWLAADVLVTDPPYGIGWKRGLNAARGSKAHRGILNDEDTSCRDAMLDLWGDKPGVVFGSLAAAFPKEVKQVLIWRKPPDAGVVGSVTGYRRDIDAVFLTGQRIPQSVRWSSVLVSGIPSVGNPSSPAGRTGHPHAKPVDLMADLIDHGRLGVVADPFAGSGSTLVAAKLLGRQAVGTEIDEAYCEVIARRLSQSVLDFGDVSS